MVWCVCGCVVCVLYGVVVVVVVVVVWLWCVCGVVSRCGCGVFGRRGGRGRCVVVVCLVWCGVCWVWWYVRRGAWVGVVWHAEKKVV